MKVKIIDYKKILLKFSPNKDEKTNFSEFVEKIQEQLREENLINADLSIELLNQISIKINDIIKRLSENNKFKKICDVLKECLPFFSEGSKVAEKISSTIDKFHTEDEINSELYKILFFVSNICKTNELPSNLFEILTHIKTSQKDLVNSCQEGIPGHFKKMASVLVEESVNSVIINHKNELIEITTNNIINVNSDLTGWSPHIINWLKNYLGVDKAKDSFMNDAIFKKSIKHMKKHLNDVIQKDLKENGLIDKLYNFVLNAITTEVDLENGISTQLLLDDNLKFKITMNLVKAGVYDLKALPKGLSTNDKIKSIIKQENLFELENENCLFKIHEKYSGFGIMVTEIIHEMVDSTKVIYNSTEDRYTFEYSLIDENDNETQHRYTYDSDNIPPLYLSLLKKSDKEQALSYEDIARQYNNIPIQIDIKPFIYRLFLDNLSEELDKLNFTKIIEHTEEDIVYTNNKKVLFKFEGVLYSYIRKDDNSSPIATPLYLNVMSREDEINLAQYYNKVRMEGEISSIYDLKIIQDLKNKLSNEAFTEIFGNNSPKFKLNISKIIATMYKANSNREINDIFTYKLLLNVLDILKDRVKILENVNNDTSIYEIIANKIKLENEKNITQHIVQYTKNKRKNNEQGYNYLIYIMREISNITPETEFLRSQLTIIFKNLINDNYYKQQILEALKAEKPESSNDNLIIETLLSVNIKSDSDSVILDKLNEYMQDNERIFLALIKKVKISSEKFDLDIIKKYHENHALYQTFMNQASITNKILFIYKTSTPADFINIIFDYEECTSINIMIKWIISVTSTFQVDKDELLKHFAKKLLSNCEANDKLNIVNENYQLKNLVSDTMNNKDMENINFSLLSHIIEQATNDHLVTTEFIEEMRTFQFKYHERIKLSKAATLKLLSLKYNGDNNHFGYVVNTALQQLAHNNEDEVKLALSNFIKNNELDQYILKINNILEKNALSISQANLIFNILIKNDLEQAPLGDSLYQAIVEKILQANKVFNDFHLSKDVMLDIFEYEIKKGSTKFNPELYYLLIIGSKKYLDDGNFKEEYDKWLMTINPCVTLYGILNNKLFRSQDDKDHLCLTLLNQMLNNSKLNKSKDIFNLIDIIFKHNIDQLIECTKILIKSQNCDNVDVYLSLIKLINTKSATELKLTKFIGLLSLQLPNFIRQLILDKIPSYDVNIYIKHMNNYHDAINVYYLASKYDNVNYHLNHILELIHKKAKELVSTNGSFDKCLEDTINEFLSNGSNDFFLNLKLAINSKITNTEGSTVSNLILTKLDDREKSKEKLTPLISCIYKSDITQLGRETFNTESMSIESLTTILNEIFYNQEDNTSHEQKIEHRKFLINLFKYYLNTNDLNLAIQALNIMNNLLIDFEDISKDNDIINYLLQNITTYEYMIFVKNQTHDSKIMLYKVLKSIDDHISSTDSIHREKSNSLLNFIKPYIEGENLTGNKISLPVELKQQIFASLTNKPTADTHQTISKYFKKDNNNNEPSYHIDTFCLSAKATKKIINQKHHQTNSNLNEAASAVIFNEAMISQKIYKDEIQSGEFNVFGLLLNIFVIPLLIRFIYRMVCILDDVSEKNLLSISRELNNMDSSDYEKAVKNMKSQKNYNSLPYSKHAIDAELIAQAHSKYKHKQIKNAQKDAILLFILSTTLMVSLISNPIALTILVSLMAFSFFTPYAILFFYSKNINKNPTIINYKNSNFINKHLKEKILRLKTRKAKNKTRRKTFNIIDNNIPLIHLFSLLKFFGYPLYLFTAPVISFYNIIKSGINLYNNIKSKIFTTNLNYFISYNQTPEVIENNIYRYIYETKFRQHMYKILDVSPDSADLRGAETKFLRTIGLHLILRRPPIKFLLNLMGYQNILPTKTEYLVYKELSKIRSCNTNSNYFEGAIEIYSNKLSHLNYTILSYKLNKFIYHELKNNTDHNVQDELTEIDLINKTQFCMNGDIYNDNKPHIKEFIDNSVKKFAIQEQAKLAANKRFNNVAFFGLSLTVFLTTVTISAIGISSGTLPIIFGIFGTGVIASSVAAKYTKYQYNKHINNSVEYSDDTKNSAKDFLQQTYNKDAVYKPIEEKNNYYSVRGISNSCFMKFRNMTRTYSRLPTNDLDSSAQSSYEEVELMNMNNRQH